MLEALRSRNIPELDYLTFVREDAIFSNGVRAVLTKGRISVEDPGGREMKVSTELCPLLNTSSMITPLPVLRLSF